MYIYFVFLDVGRMAREKTTGFKALAKWENDENEDDKQPLRAVLVELNKSHTRDAIREQLDKLSQVNVLCFYFVCTVQIS